MVHYFSIELCDKETGEVLGSVRRNLPWEVYSKGVNPAKDLIDRWVLAMIRGREKINGKFCLAIAVEPAHNFYVESKIPFLTEDPHTYVSAPKTDI